MISVLGADTTDPAKTTRYDYDDAGQLVARTDPNGHRTTYTYDSAGRLASTTDPLGRAKQYGYDQDGHQTSVVTARGTGAGQPGGVPTQAAGTITQTYDTLGRLTTRTLGSGGAAHSFGYDANGRLTTAVDPSGTQKREYDDSGRITSVARGTETFRYGYDAAGNTINRTYPDGTAIDSVLDDNGRVISQTTNSQTIGYSYDPAGQLTRIQYPQPTGQTESREYDAAGRLVKVSNDKTASAQASGAGFTPLSAPARILDTRDSTGGHQARLGAGEEFALTVAGVPAEATAVVLNVTGVAPSAATHIDIYPSNFTGTSTLNLALGQVSAVAAFTALGPNRTVKVRNDAGSVDVVVDVVGYFTNSGTAGYTAAPAPVRVLDTRENIGGHQATVAPGEVVELQMRGIAGVPADATSVIVNVTGVAPSSSTHLDVYAKDWGGTSTLNLDAGAVRANLAVTGIGADGKIRIRNDRGNVHLVVDLQGWFAPNAGSRFVSLAAPQRVLDTRDSTGGHQGAFGPAEQFDLPLAGKYGVPGDASAVVFNLTGVGPTTGTVLSAWPAGKTFNGASNVNIDAGKVVPNAVVSGTGTGGSVALRNSAGQIHAIVDLAGYFARPPPAGGSQVLSRFDLTLDPTGNPSKIINTRGTTTRTDVYTYDATDRVTAVCSGATSCASAPTRTSYTYDLVGNRLTQNQTGGPQAGSTNYTYDAADQLTTVTAPGGAATNYTYDRDGNQTQAGADTSAYDLTGRLTSATTGGKTVAYSYDTEGNRLSSTAGNTKYAWDINNPLPLLATESGADARSYRYAPGGMPVAMSTAGKSFHYGHDWLGGVRDVVSDAGVPQYAYDYQPFGDGPNTDPQPLVQGAPANPLRYAGEYLDATTGLYNLRARQYAPTLGRFTAVDPVPPAATSPYPSAYLYAGGKATTAVDPSGNCWWLPWSDDGSSCPGAQTARDIGNAAVGVGKGVYHTAEGALNSVLHPIDSLQGAAESCWEGFKHSLYMGCIGNTLGIYQLFGIGQKCPPNLDTTEFADHLTQVGLGIILLGRGGHGRGLVNRAGQPWAGKIKGGARPDGQTVFSGHGAQFTPTTPVQVPPGTWLRFYVRPGKSLYDHSGLGIERGKDPKLVMEYGPGTYVPDHVLGPPEGLTIRKGSYTVDTPTYLSDILEPNMGVCHWAACRNFEDAQGIQDWINDIQNGRP